MEQHQQGASSSTNSHGNGDSDASRGGGRKRGRHGHHGRQNKQKQEYKQLNMQHLLSMFGHLLDEQAIWLVFKQRQYDMNATLEELQERTGFHPPQLSAVEDDVGKSVDNKNSNSNRNNNNNSTSSKDDNDSNSNSEGQRQILELKGDLFSCDNDASLAHCVSRDLRMGKGVAVAFKSKFGGMDELKAQNKGIGEVAILHPNNRFVYYLITKEAYWNKPTYGDLKACLEQMKLHCVANKVTKLCMPRIGCGLDGLIWNTVKSMLKEVFGDTDIVVTVYTL